MSWFSYGYTDQGYELRGFSGDHGGQQAVENCINKNTPFGAAPVSLPYIGHFPLDRGLWLVLAKPAGSGTFFGQLAYEAEYARNGFSPYRLLVEDPLPEPMLIEEIGDALNYSGDPLPIESPRYLSFAARLFESLASDDRRQTHQSILVGNQRRGTAFFTFREGSADDSLHLFGELDLTRLDPAASKPADSPGQAEDLNRAIDALRLRVEELRRDLAGTLRTELRDLRHAARVEESSLREAVAEHVATALRPELQHLHPAPGEVEDLAEQLVTQLNDTLRGELRDFRSATVDESDKRSEALEKQIVTTLQPELYRLQSSPQGRLPRGWLFGFAAAIVMVFGVNVFFFADILDRVNQADASHLAQIDGLRTLVENQTERVQHMELSLSGNQGSVDAGAAPLRALMAVQVEHLTRLEKRLGFAEEGAESLRELIVSQTALLAGLESSMAGNLGNAEEGAESLRELIASQTVLLAGLESSMAGNLGTAEEGAESLRELIASQTALLAGLESSLAGNLGNAEEGAESLRELIASQTALLAGLESSMAGNLGNAEEGAESLRDLIASQTALLAGLESSLAGNLGNAEEGAESLRDLIASQTALLAGLESSMTGNLGNAEEGAESLRDLIASQTALLAGLESSMTGNLGNAEEGAESLRELIASQTALLAGLESSMTGNLGSAEEGAESLRELIASQTALLAGLESSMTGNLGSAEEGAESLRDLIASQTLLLAGLESSMTGNLGNAEEGAESLRDLIASQTALLAGLGSNLAGTLGSANEDTGKLKTLISRQTELERNLRGDGTGPDLGPTVP